MARNPHNAPKAGLVTGYLLAAVAAATYGMNPLFAVPLYEHEGMNADSVLLFRYLFALPMIAALALARGRTLRLPRQAALPTAILGLLVGLSSLTLFLSYNYMNSGIASTLLFVYPILVAVIMAIFFRERISALLVVCIAVTSAGIALLYHGGDEGGDYLSGSILVGVSALTYALYIVLVNRPRLAQIPTLPLTFWMLAAGVAIFAVRVAVWVPLTLPHHWYYWGNLLGLAFFPTAVSFVCTTRAIQIIGSTPTAILGALEPVAAIVFGITLLGQGITPREGIGLALIIVAVTAVIAGAHLPRLLNRARRMFPPLRRRRQHR